MKKRTSIYFEDEDRRMLRFLIRKAAKEEGYVPSATGSPRQDEPTR
jgi:hypothetical protein